MKTILSILEEFIKKLFSLADSIPKLFVEVIKGIDINLSMKFSVGLGVVAGLLFLHWITPAVVFPHEYGVLPKEKLTIHGQKALVVCGKILQTLANGSKFDPVTQYQWAPSNRFIRRYEPSWQEFFHYVLLETGKKPDTAPQVNIGVTPDEIMEISNQNAVGVDSVSLNKQKELVAKLFAMEKQTEGWSATTTFKGHDWKFKQFDRRWLGRVTFTVDFPPKDIYQMFTERNYDPRIIKLNVVASMNENLRISHTVINTPAFFQLRDLVTIRYCDFFEEENFGFFLMSSIEYPPNHPLYEATKPTKRYVRAETESGYFLRSFDENQTEITYIVHVEPKGNMRFPESVTKKMLIANQFNLIVGLKAAVEEKKATKSGKQERTVTISPAFEEYDFVADAKKLGVEGEQ